jgi:TPR repeat protein
MSPRQSLLAALLAFGVATTAQAHSPGVPQDPEQLARYRAGLAAYYKQDHAAALEAWRPMAEKGSSAAQLFLGFMHARGQGVTQDDRAAAEWYRRAAEQDNMLAQIRLAVMYRRGQGVSQDPVAAHLWASLATRDEKHLRNVATALRRAVEKDMTPEQIAEAEQLRRDWLKQHKTSD